MRARNVRPILASIFLGASVYTSTVSAALPPLKLSDNGHFLVNAENGGPIFLLADTAWGLARRLKRDDVDFYLRTRHEQGFNAVTFVAIGSNSDISKQSTDAYGHIAVAMTNGKPDPTKPLITPGNRPDRPDEYDFWDHLDYCIDQCAAHHLYAIVLPTWGSWVVGTYNGKDTREVVFNENNAQTYGHFIGSRYKDRTNVIWMLGGDRAAVNDDKDYRPVFRALAQGIRDGAGISALISYHPRKGAPQSSDWFHEEGWLTFNSIQEWPDNQIPWISKDWLRDPMKPTWVFEGRYENYHRGIYKPEQWGAWQCRQQAYQSVFAGAFGHTYGNEKIFGFPDNDIPPPGDKDKPAPGSWRDHLNDPGTLCMPHLARLMATLSREQYLSRIPAQDLIDGDAGKAQRLASDHITATRGRGGDYAMVYSANGRPFRLKMDQLTGPTLAAFWYDPRTGKWHRDDGANQNDPISFANSLAAGTGAATKEFVPPGAPGDGNDWVLVLKAASR